MKVSELIKRLQELDNPNMYVESKDLQGNIAEVYNFTVEEWDDDFDTVVLIT